MSKFIVYAPFYTSLRNQCFRPLKKPGRCIKKWGFMQYALSLRTRLLKKELYKNQGISIAKTAHYPSVYKAVLSICMLYNFSKSIDIISKIATTSFWIGYLPLVDRMLQFPFLIPESHEQPVTIFDLVPLTSLPTLVEILVVAFVAL